ncbi:hypothetical protein [Meiothermus granaticius]|nr:hypothetical protein [Meiothermus granaticius]MCL6526396.1 hypothetical protein [Thermaceae bacterium]
MSSKSLNPSGQVTGYIAPRFNWMVVAFSGWMVGGIHLDAWAHHRIAETLETFFTPWHGVLYSGFLALAALLVGRTLAGVRTGLTWRQATPKGYELSLLGVALFMLGGVGDMLWHLAFGIEVNVEARLSPTHLLLALGGSLMVTGPVRAAGVQGQATLWPALISLAFLLSLLTFFSAYASPISDGQLAAGNRLLSEQTASLLEGKGVAAMLLQTLTLMGVVLFAVRRWRLPLGSITLLLGLSSLLTIAAHQDWFLLPAVLLTGFLGDAFYAWLGPAPGHLLSLQGFAFLLPVLFYVLYFLTLQLDGGLWWRVHLWAEATLMAGMASWLLSLLPLESGKSTAS